MTAKQHTDRFVTLPQRQNAVSDGSRLQTHFPTTDDTSKARCCAKHRFVPSCNHPRVLSGINHAGKSQPSTALKSP